MEIFKICNSRKSIFNGLSSHCFTDYLLVAYLSFIPQPFSLYLSSDYPKAKSRGPSYQEFSPMAISNPGSS